jgi:hypothetical protein
MNYLLSIVTISFSLLTACTARSQSTIIRVVVENYPNVPGQATVTFPFFPAKIATDGHGRITLPRPHSGYELITVEPKDPVYGPAFMRGFPSRDGLISLKAIPVTASIRAKAEELIAKKQPARAALAYALTAAREPNPKAAAAFRVKAFEALGDEYNVDKPYAYSGAALRASPTLVDSINKTLGKTAVAEDGNFTMSDFRVAAKEQSLSPIVKAAQAKHLESLKR